MKFYIADAFTEKLFGGNPAGVVILDDGSNFPADQVMRKTAAELRYSETAFIRKLSENKFNIRYFTPADEVDLCGHATIASFVCLLDAGLVQAGNKYINETLAGSLEINVDEGFTMMEMSSPEHIDTISNKAALEELYGIMGLDYEPVMIHQEHGDDLQLVPMMISTGLPDIIMPVTSCEKLAAITPNFEQLTRLSKKYNVVGVHAFAFNEKSSGITAHCRNFAPLYDIDEEAATGTSNGALTYYLYKYGLLSDGTESTFIQGEAMDRPSKVLSRIRIADGKGCTVDCAANFAYDCISDHAANGAVDCVTDCADNIQIQVGGSAVILAKGEVNL